MPEWITDISVLHLWNQAPWHLQLCLARLSVSPKISTPASSTWTKHVHDRCKTKIPFGPWVLFAVSNPEPVREGQTWTGNNSAKDEPLHWRQDRQQQGLSECATGLGKKRALQVQETYLATSKDWRKWRGNSWGSSLVSAPHPQGCLSLDQCCKGEVSLFFFF